MKHKQFKLKDSKYKICQVNYVKGDMLACDLGHNEMQEIEGIQQEVFVNESGSTFIPKDAVKGWSDEDWENRNKDKDGNDTKEFV